MSTLPPSSLPDPLQVKAEKMLDLDFYTEGPAVDTDGRIFFTDIAGQHIKYYADGKEFNWSKGKRPNGQAIKKNGDHLICDSQLGAVLQYDATGRLIAKVSPTFIDQIAVSCPNDIALDTQGGFYFTDSVRHRGAVYHVDEKGTAKALVREVDFANGIVLDWKRNRLYVSESYKNRILKLDLNKQKSDEAYVSVFADLPKNQANPDTGNLPDGLKLDVEGRLWVAHYGMQALQVLSEEGELLATYDTGIPLTSNLCFREDEIWITGGTNEPGPGRLTKITIGISGFPLI